MPNVCKITSFANVAFGSGVIKLYAPLDGKALP